jgi:hypothetical protein
MMQRSKDKPPAGDDWDFGSASERRRLSKIVHDERGNARVEWVDAPQDVDVAESARPTLAIDEPEPSAHHGYDPYGRAPRPQPGKLAAPKREPTSKRDLRKLSEWIKQMRALEERKRGDEEE